MQRLFLCAVLALASSPAAAQFRTAPLPPLRGWSLPAAAAPLPALGYAARFDLRFSQALPPLPAAPMGLGDKGDKLPPKPEKWSPPTLGFDRGVPGGVQEALRRAIHADLGKALSFVLGLGVAVNDVNDLHFDVVSVEASGGKAAYAVSVKRRGGAGATLAGFEAAVDLSTFEVDYKDKIDAELRKRLRRAGIRDAVPVRIKIKYPAELAEGEGSVEDRLRQRTVRQLSALFRGEAARVLAYLDAQGVAYRIGPLSFTIRAELSPQQALALSGMMPVEGMRLNEDVR